MLASGERAREQQAIACTATGEGLRSTCDAGDWRLQSVQHRHRLYLRLALCVSGVAPGTVSHQNQLKPASSRW